MLRTVYGFDDLGRKVPTGSYDDGLLPVGGKIFYIDSNSDETVKFYDAQGNELSNVGVGDTPAYYKITSAGISEKEKYYVYDTTTGLLTSKYWGYYTITTEAKSDGIGVGKSNTAMVLAIKDTSSYSVGSIWETLKLNNSNKVAGCNDWFIGSNAELTQLKDSSLVDWFYNPVWSSIEFTNMNAYYWYNTGSFWHYNSKGASGYCCFIRSF